MSTEVTERILEERAHIADVLERHWKRTMPTAPCPVSDQFFLWSSLHPLDTMIFAIRKVSRKRMVLDGKMDLDFMVRYTSSVAIGFDKAKGLIQQF